MKVLVNRTWSLLSSHLVIASINYNWSIKSEYGIFITLIKYLRINHIRGKEINWNSVTPCNFGNIISLLSSSSLRSLIKLSEYILKRPALFDLFINSVYSISSIQLEKILCQGSPNLDRLGTKTGLIALLW